MSEHKPLTAEERETHADCCKRLLDAEAYWREAVKNLPEWMNESDGMHPDQCIVCSGSRQYHDHEIKHDVDCPWLLAQEE